MLTPAVTSQHQLEEVGALPGDRLQCLRCGREFKPEEPRLGLDSEEGWKPLFRKTGTSPALDPLGAFVVNLCREGRILCC